MQIQIKLEKQTRGESTAGTHRDPGLGIAAMAGEKKKRKQVVDRYQRMLLIIIVIVINSQDCGDSATSPTLSTSFSFSFPLPPPMLSLLFL